MSLAIVVSTTEGIVLAADSRQSYRNLKGMGRIGSDSAQKVFPLNNRVAVSVTGLAFIAERGVPKNISRFIEEFVRIKELDKLTVRQISNEMHSFFAEKYDYKTLLKELPKQIEANLVAQGSELLEHNVQEGNVVFKFKDTGGEIRQGVANVEPLDFLVAGYNSDGSHMVCNVRLPGSVTVKRNSKQVSHEYGADWVGQKDVITRIVLGFDNRIVNLPLMQKAITDTSNENVIQQLQGLEYVIQWGTMTLQDAIDFSRLAIETTTSIQRFSDGIKLDPGDMPGVGGAIDIAYIKPTGDFTWLSKKELNI